MIASDYSTIAVDGHSHTVKWFTSYSNMYLNLSNVQEKSTYNEEYVSGHGDLHLVIDQLAFSMSPAAVWLKFSDYFPWTTNSTF